MSIALRQEENGSTNLEHLRIARTSGEGEPWTCRLERRGEADAMAAERLGLHLHSFIERARDAAPDGRAVSETKDHPIPGAPAVGLAGLYGDHSTLNCHPAGGGFTQPKGRGLKRRLSSSPRRFPVA